MKNLFFLVSFLLITSCDKDNSQLIKDERLNSLYKNFNSISEFIDYSKIQTFNAQSKNNEEALITVPIIKDENVIGRFYGINNGTEGFYVDFSNYTKEITVYDANNPLIREVIKMELNDEGMYVPILNNKTIFYCRLSCTIGTMAISASDGPLPLLDILAVAYFASCMAGC